MIHLINVAPLVKYVLLDEEDIPALIVDMSTSSLGKEEFNNSLAVLLAAHKRGAYVDPHEYEGLITHAIECGKSTMFSKLYYIIHL